MDDVSQNQAVVFSNRLKKRHKHLSRWARRVGTTCFRIYDRDVPELPFTVEVYGSNLVVAAHMRPEEAASQARRDWVDTMVSAAARALSVQPDNVYLKTRTPQKGNSQYERLRAAGRKIEVVESNLRFIVNLSDYLDTGLFLDHRDTRSMIRDTSAGKSVLNLFCYTGSFSVHAAAGGATSVTSVDLSNTYLAWAEENMSLNGLFDDHTTFVRADVAEYLRGCLERKNRFDIIILDPPTFSNSKKMDGTLDILRDHPALINTCLRLLSPDGFVLFSTNHRKFRLRLDEIESREITDITNTTIPTDFRDRKIHKCFILRRDSNQEPTGTTAQKDRAPRDRRANVRPDRSNTKSIRSRQSGHPKARQSPRP